MPPQARVRPWWQLGGGCAVALAVACSVHVWPGFPGRPVKAAADRVSMAALPVVPPTAPVDTASLPPALRELGEPSFGDFEAMRERRVVRVLTSFSRGFYFLDGAEQRGATYELIRHFESELNDRYAHDGLGIRVIVVPVPHDRLLEGLAAGYGDIAAANLTVTPSRLQRVDFADPFLTGVEQIIAAGPSALPLDDLDDLAGREIAVRSSSSHVESLERLNDSFRVRGLPEVRITVVPGLMLDEDLLDMVSAGEAPMTVVDSHQAAMWTRLYPAVAMRQDLAIRRQGAIAWAIRRDSPALRQVVDAFVRTHREGSRMGNIVFGRYLHDTRWAAAAGSGETEAAVELVRKYADRYGLDWLMVAAQGFQESRLDQDARSHRGAVGVMQVLPTTAAEPYVGIGDIDRLENNIHAGVKYLAFLREHYFDDPALDELNRELLALAAYNAGPQRIAELRERAASSRLDPNVWFDNVELAASRSIGRETVQYVSNIYTNYVAYRLLANNQGERLPGQLQ